MLSFEENYIADEKERLQYLLNEYLTFLARHATPTTLRHHEYITRLLSDKTPHSELLDKIGSIFSTDDCKPKSLNLTDDIENKLGPNRSAEYLGLHADICFMVTQFLSSKR